MPVGVWLAVMTAYSLIVPVGVIFPIAPGLLLSVNHRLPSGPCVMSVGTPVAPEYSLIVPSVAIRPILPLLMCSVNHSAPSGPAVMFHGLELELRPALYSVTWPVV